ncbi:MAG: alpha-1,2-fucosyltransferase, partial [Pyrinomonadaceae bacterium]
DNVYLKGYWQSPRYFESNETQIRQDFTFREEMNQMAQELCAEILSKNSVCVSVRRGDYVKNDLLPCFGADYFQAADKVFRGRLTDYSYYVFSDDIEWCKANLKFDVPTIFVSEEYSGRKYQDKLRLMSACKHFVIPNSSYVWWAVWFNTNADKIVIAPKNWFFDPSVMTRDLIPTTWISI